MDAKIEPLIKKRHDCYSWVVYTPLGESTPLLGLNGYAPPRRQLEYGFWGLKSRIAKSLGLIIPCSQCVSGHVVRTSDTSPK